MTVVTQRGATSLNRVLLLKINKVEANSTEESVNSFFEAEPHCVTVVTQRGATSLNRV